MDNMNNQTPGQAPGTTQSTSKKKKIILTVVGALVVVVVVIGTILTITHFSKGNQSETPDPTPSIQVEQQVETPAPELDEMKPMTDEDTQREFGFITVEPGQTEAEIPNGDGTTTTVVLPPVPSEVITPEVDGTPPEQTPAPVEPVQPVEKPSQPVEKPAKPVEKPSSNVEFAPPPGIEIISGGGPGSGNMITGPGGGDINDLPDYDLGITGH